MEIGIVLPSGIPGTDPQTVWKWAKAADTGPFSSVAVIDRIVYGNYDPLNTLASVAAVTERVRLLTAILIAPLRPVGLLAKQAATVDRLSGGRLTLGMAVGRREDDFEAAPASFGTRGRRMEEMIGQMRRVWSGEPLQEGMGVIGPMPVQPGGPEILIGGRSERARSRAARLADGYIPGSMAGLDEAARHYREAKEEFGRAGRTGPFRFVATSYFSARDTSGKTARAYMEDYYGFLGPAAGAMADSVPSGPDAIKAWIQEVSAAGADELILIPCTNELEELEQLASIVESMS